VRLLKLAFIALAATTLTGCFKIDVVHQLQPHGVNDSGRYRVSMNAFTYGMLQHEDEYGKMVRKLRAFSRPQTRHADGLVHLEDLSDTAAMERMYDTYTCTPSSVGYVDCRFATRMNFGDTPGWAVDWAVALPAWAELVRGNQQRVRRDAGGRMMYWHFDGGTDRVADIDFTVRVPKASS
jgi:hypothetical protein